MIIDHQFIENKIVSAYSCRSEDQREIEGNCKFATVNSSEINYCTTNIYIGTFLNDYLVIHGPLLL